MKKNCFLFACLIGLMFSSCATNNDAVALKDEIIWKNGEPHFHISKYIDNQDIELNKVLYKSIPPKDFIIMNGDKVQTIFELNGVEIKTYISTDGNWHGIYINDILSKTTLDKVAFRFFDYNPENEKEINSYGWAPMLYGVKIGDKKYDIIIGQYWYYKYGQRMWVREK